MVMLDEGVPAAGTEAPVLTVEEQITGAHPDLDVIFPLAESMTVTLEDGAVMPVVVRRLKARELLALMQCVTVGMGPGIAQIRISDDGDEAAGQILGLLITAIPNSGDYFFRFVAMLVAPQVPSKDNVAKLHRYFADPDIDVMLEVLERMIVAEREDLSALMGKVRTSFKRIQQAYRTTGTPNIGPRDHLPAPSI